LESATPVVAAHRDPAVRSPATLHIVPVESARDLRRFIDVPWRVYDREAHPQWVPPLRLLVRDALDTRRNRFYARADRALWLALRGGRPVGRIAAIENRAHNEFHGDRVGFFGFFETLDDQDAATALLDTAAAWLRARGLTVMRGPVSPSTNHECGLLVDGFESHPTFMTSWNPQYYAGLLEGAGLAGVKDLLGYFVPMDDPRFTLPAQFETHARRAMAKQRLTFRDLDMRRWNQEVALCWEVYNAAWEANWGFVPMARDEFEQMAQGLKHIVWPQLAFAAEIDGVPAGVCLAVPDYNQLLKRIPSGRLLPTGLVKILLGRRRLRTARVMMLGVKPQYRASGIFALFTHELYRRGRESGVIGGEASWILEDNELMNRPLRALGLEEYRRWRIFEKPLT
jgi:GNAT superfamily N-acetyltransferase